MFWRMRLKTLDGFKLLSYLFSFIYLGGLVEIVQQSLVVVHICDKGRDM